jgi:hypothetical protein
MTKTDPVIRCTDDTGAEGEYYLLDRKIWKEARKVQGKEKGKPYTILENGTVILSRIYAGKGVRIFIKEDDEDGNSED